MTSRFVTLRGARVGAGVIAALGLVAVPVASAGTPPDGIIAAGVSIDGVPVGGYTAGAARSAVIVERVAPRAQPLVLSMRGRRMAIKPLAAGYSADVDGAVAAALALGRTVPIAGPTDVPLVQRVDRARLRRVLKYRARDVELKPIDARLYFRGSRPKVRKGRAGTLIHISKSIPVVANAMIRRDQFIVDLPVRRVRPARPLGGPSIVVDRGRRLLTLYREERKIRTFRIAVGTPRYPTPRGVFRIITKQKNPTWFPPNSPWARGLGPVPPGSGNPLGTRWMGTSAPAIGIHGTPASSSIGTAASHGCIRMYIRQAEWLYERVRVGTPVKII